MTIIKRILFLLFVLLECLSVPVASAKASDNNILLVGTERLEQLLSTAKHSAPATVISLNDSVISAEITGRALRIHVQSGDFVQKGDKLVTLDCRSYKLARKQAKSALKLAITQLNHAKKQFVRSQKLLKQRTIPREFYDKAEASHLMALADIELKKINIESTALTIQRCIIHAPFSGQITKRMVQKGQLVSAGTPLLQLMQSYHKEVVARLSPASVIQLKASPVIDLVVNKKQSTLKIRSIIQNIDEQTRVQEVRLSLPQKAKFAAGLSGRIEWRDTARQLPAEYMIRRNNQLGVMIAEAIVKGVGKAKFVSLPNAKEGQAATISLSSDTTIITDNRYRVRDGDVIKIQ